MRQVFSNNVNVKSGSDGPNDIKKCGSTFKVGIGRVQNGCNNKNERQNGKWKRKSLEKRKRKALPSQIH